MKALVSAIALLAVLSCANMCLGQASMPAAPTTDPPDWIVNPSLSNTGAFTVSWDASTTAGATYALEADTDPNFGAPQQVYSGSATQFACTGFADGGWFLRVLASSSSAATSVALADHPTWVDSALSTPPAGPGVPAGLTAPAQSGPAFTVSWTRLAGAVYYQLQQEYLVNSPLYPVPTGYYPQPVVTTIYDGANNAVLVAPVSSDGDWYRFRARAYVLFQGYRVYDAWTPWTAQVDVASALPGAPFAVYAAGSSSGGTVTLTVGNAFGATSYEFKEALDSSFANAVQVYPAPGGGPVPTGMAGYTLSGRTDGTYFYQVRALNAFGASAWTISTVGAVVTGNPPSSAPAAPSLLTVQPSSCTGWYTVSWTGVAGASSYRLEEDVTSTFSGPSDVTPSSAQTSVQLYKPADGTYFYRVRAANALGTSAWTLGPNPCVVALSSALCAVTGHPAAPAFADIQAGETGFLVLAFTVTADAAVDTRIQSLTVTSTGTGDEASDIAGITLYRDTDADGAWTPGTDAVLAGPAGFSADDGTAAFPALARSIAAGGSETWFVVADFGGAASGGEDFRFALAGYSGSLVAVADATGVAMTVTGLPLTGTRATVFTNGIPGTLFVAAASNAPADGVVDAGTFGVVMAAATLTAGNVEAVNLVSMAVTASGTGDDSSEASWVVVAEDVDLDGAYTSGTDRIMAAAPVFPSDDGTATFALSGETIPAYGSMTVLVVYDVSAWARAGVTFTAVLDAGSVAALGVTSGQSVPVLGLPVAGRTVTLAAAPAPEKSSGGCAGGSGAGGGGAALPLLALALLVACRRKRALRPVR